MDEQSGCRAATHDEICDRALTHYREVASSACHWSKTVEMALQFYRQHGPQAPTQGPPDLEKLAALAHEQWSGWMRWIFGKCVTNLEPGCMIIPRQAVDRWKRLMNTPYAQLSEDEKQGDRADASAVLDLVAAPQGALALDQAWAEIRDTMGDTLLNAQQKEAFVRSILAGVLANPVAAPQDDLEIIAERDQYHDWADTLAYAVAPLEEIGEHSNVNNPWQNALDILEQRVGSQGETEMLREAARQAISDLEAARDHISARNDRVATDYVETAMTALEDALGGDR